ncbi:MAG: O-antigen ligase family protein [Victivallales bacterium]|nr:O-antigen ligase family protein [Victivallales bacterium]
MEFTYKGMIRYGYGFDNPNHAAALITMLLPVLWTIRADASRRLIKYPVLGMELVLYVALFYTYSRAGVLALMFAGVFFCLSRRIFIKHKAFSLPRGANLYMSGATLLVIATGLVYSGLASRLIKTFTSPDRAITNRFSLWSKGVKMLNDIPDGVGTGLSGQIYTLFYLPPDCYLSYRTMVNSFLTFAVEQGVLVSAVVFGVMLAIIGTALLFICKNIALKNIIICALTVIVSGTVSGLLSTCFDISLCFSGTNNILQYLLLGIWLAGFITSIVCIVVNRRDCEVLSLKLGGIAGLMLMISVSGCYMLSPGASAVGISSPEKGIVVINPENPGASGLILPDFNLDNLKEQIHTIIRHYPDKQLAIVIDRHVNLKFSREALNAKEILLYGSSTTGMLCDLPEDKKIIIFNPDLPARTAIPPERIAGIYLNSYDEHGVNFLWEKLASETIKYY